MKANKRLRRWVDEVGLRHIANLLGVTRGAVSHWATGRRQLPASVAVQIERVTHGGITRKELLPEVFGEIE